VRPAIDALFNSCMVIIMTAVVWSLSRQQLYGHYMISSNYRDPLSTSTPQPPSSGLYYGHCRLQTCPLSKLLMLQHCRVWHTLCGAISGQQLLLASKESL